MSHITGVVITLDSPIVIGPDTNDPPDGPNTWSHNFIHEAAPDGTKLLILHFTNVSLPPGNRLEVDLGYDTDVFTSADGDSFWTRPVNIYVVPGGQVPIRYVADGSLAGSVELDAYGRGQRHIGDLDPTAYSNCDPFLGDPQYTEPDYDPFWYCSEPPQWENAACAPNDVRQQVAPSVGMMIHAHFDDDDPSERHLSTCTVTLVDADKVITAGHCLNPEEPLEVESCSVVFGYQTDCAGNRIDPYNPVVHKIAAVLSQRYQGGHDYCLIQLATPVVGIPPVQLRHDLPAAGEQVFCIHHPNGAVKKLSTPSPGFTTVLSSGALSVRVPDDLDISGGSSGSGLFDLAGRIIGILSGGNPCSNPNDKLAYYPIATFLDDTLPAPPPPVERDVMLIVDRSGSMSEDDGTGRQKIEVARDAVSLFVQLVRAGTGNRVGLTAFSTSPDLITSMTAVDNAAKEDLIGTAPYSGGEVGDLNPGGSTSIGGGLQTGHADLDDGGPNPKAILLLSDGMQNTAPLISEVEDEITSTVHAIGFGTESNLDGPLLDELATSHGGLYMRAGNGLALEKFFSQAFGNIFENGILFDPEFNLPAGASGRSIEFPVCGEETITAVAGWDRTNASLLLELTTPGGQVITGSTAGVEDATGITWTFLRLSLPHNGERNGTWKVRVVRPAGPSEFPPPAPQLRYFINVIPLGGPRLLQAGSRRRRYYTGDRINPMVMLRYGNGGWPQRSKVTLTLTRPNQGAGNLLAQAGLGPAGSQNGDVLPARFATLQALEAQAGQPLVQFTQSSFAMTTHPRDTGGSFEHSGGIHGKLLVDQLTTEGNYTMHVKATYGEKCKGSRELAWGVSVSVGIDPEKTGVSVTPLDSGTGDRECLRLIITPRDRYGNHLGPGRADGFELQPVAGTTIESEVVDLGNGSYRVDICWDPSSGEPPGVDVAQPGRDPVRIITPTARQYLYSVKFLCGVESAGCCGCHTVQPGRYSTEITIHNFHSREVRVGKRVIPVVLAGAIKGREPNVARVAAVDRVILPPHSATMDDCCRLWELLLGAPTNADVPLTSGVLEITSPVELNVTAVYTATDARGRSIAVNTVIVEPRRTEGPARQSSADSGPKREVIE